MNGVGVIGGFLQGRRAVVGRRTGRYRCDPGRTFADGRLRGASLMPTDRGPGQVQVQQQLVRRANARVARRVRRGVGDGHQATQRRLGSCFHGPRPGRRSSGRSRLAGFAATLTCRQIFRGGSPAGRCSDSCSDLQPVHRVHPLKCSAMGRVLFDWMGPMKCQFMGSSADRPACRGPAGRFPPRRRPAAAPRAAAGLVFSRRAGRPWRIAPRSLRCLTDARGTFAISLLSWTLPAPYGSAVGVGSTPRNRRPRWPSSCSSVEVPVGAGHHA